MMMLYAKRTTPNSLSSINFRAIQEAKNDKHLEAKVAIKI